MVSFKIKIQDTTNENDEPPIESPGLPAGIKNLRRLIQNAADKSGFFCEENQQNFKIDVQILMDETTKQNLKGELPLGPSKSKNCPDTPDSEFFSKQEFDCEIFISDTDLKKNTNSFKNLERKISTILSKTDIQCSQIDECILLSNIELDFDPDAAIILSENDSKIELEQAQSLSSQNPFKIDIPYTEPSCSQSPSQPNLDHLEVSFDNTDWARGQEDLASEIEDLVL